MKKIFLLLSVCLITFGVFGQTQGKIRGGIAVPQTTQEDITSPGIFLPSNDPTVRSPQEQIVGKTWFDTQSNNALSNRFYRFDDGRMVATWTGGREQSAFPDRGSFYNYFNGSDWTSNPDDITRIEDVRSGWPSWAPLGNGEVLASHDGNGINIWTRATVGEGTWTKKSTIPGGGTWPRICVYDGVIHLVAAVQNTTVTPAQTTLHYSKSTDGGATWSPQHVPFSTAFPDFNYSVYCYTADCYVWAEPVNGTIALSLVCTLGDIIIYKSTNNGSTWQKITVYDSPVKNWDATYETGQTTCPGSAQSLVIDSEGKCHLAFLTHLSNAYNGASGWNIYTYLLYSWAYYWNEDLPPFSYADPYNVFDPEENMSLQNDNRLILPMGFDFEGSGIGLEYQNLITWSRNWGMINGITMAAATPDRMILALDIQDMRALYADTFSQRVFACSYIKEGNTWKLDENWITDPYMASFDIYTQAPKTNAGWYCVTLDAHPIENCNHSQLVVDKTGGDAAKFYIFFNVDSTPGEAGGSNLQNPQYNSYTENKITLYSEYVNFTGPGEEPPTITTTALPDGKEGDPYNQALQATGTPPIKWSLESGNLPVGLSLSELGVISGTPTEEDKYQNFTFKVKATNDFGFDEKEYTIFIDSIVKPGIISIENSPIKVYPNPANDILYVVNENQQHTQVKIFDFLGREVMNQDLSDKTGIDISKLPAGVYNLQIKYGDIVENRKVVKK